MFKADDSIRAELNEPYAILLSNEVREAVATRPTGRRTTRHLATAQRPNTKTPQRPSGRQGVNYEVMVGAPGIEPGLTHKRPARLPRHGLLPTLLTVVGWLVLLARRQWLVALVPLLGLLGYAYFTIGYPTRDGDVLKASYMLTTATAWALCFGVAVESLARRRALGYALALVLLATAAVDLRFLLY